MVKSDSQSEAAIGESVANEKPGNTCEDSLFSLFQTLDKKKITRSENECSKWLDRIMLVMIFK